MYNFYGCLQKRIYYTVTKLYS